MRDLIANLALGIYFKLMKGEQNSEVEFIASNRKQAGICFDMAKKLLKTLGINNAKYFKFYRDKVDFKPSQSFLQVLSADGDSNDGWNSNCFICDEYHTHSNTCKIYDVMKSSQNFRKEPLAIVITTAGHSITSNCYKMPSQPVNLEDFRGMYATGGLDLAVTRDLTAFSIMIENNSVYYFKTWYYLPKTALNNNNPNSELYKQWANQGYLTVTPSNTTDYDYILKDILKINNDYEILYYSFKQKLNSI